MRQAKSLYIIILFLIVFALSNAAALTTTEKAAIDNLLNDFMTAYKAGNINKLSGLFAATATIEGRTYSINQIGPLFSQLFAKQKDTKIKEIQVTDRSNVFRSINPNSAVGTVTFQITIAVGGQNKKIDSKITFALIKMAKASDWRILEMSRLPTITVLTSHPALVATTTTISAVVKPDLTITQFNLTENATTADRISYWLEITNKGTATASFPAGSAYFSFTNPLTGSPWGQTFHSAYAVAPGQKITSGQYMFEPGELAAGTYTIQVKADPDDVIAESNENNNALTYKWTLAQGGKPDLMISGIKVDPAQGTAPASFDVTVTIKNLGTGPAIFNYKSTIASCPDLGVHTASPSEVRIEPNAIYEARFTEGNLPAGGYTWEFTVDPNSVIPELNETNNKKSVQVRVSQQEP